MRRGESLAQIQDWFWKKRESFIILFMSFYPKTKSMFWSQNSTPIWLEVMSSVGKVRFQSWSPIPKLHLQLQSKWALCFLPSPPKQEFFLCSVWKLIFLWKTMTWVFLSPPKKNNHAFGSRGDVKWICHLSLFLHLRGGGSFRLTEEANSYWEFVNTMI